MGDKEFISTGAANSGHTDMLNIESKNNVEKKFNSVSSMAEHVIDLIDMDDHQTIQNKEEDTFSNFMSAPSV